VTNEEDEGINDAQQQFLDGAFVTVFKAEGHVFIWRGTRRHFCHGQLFSRIIGPQCLLYSEAHNKASAPEYVLPLRYQDVEPILITIGCALRDGSHYAVIGRST
jgi:hypothetical protein